MNAPSCSSEWEVKYLSLICGETRVGLAIFDFFRREFLFLVGVMENRLGCT